MRSVWAAVGLTVYLLAGCGSPPAPPPVDAAAERDDEQRIRAAASEERKGQAKGKGKAARPARNPDDDD